MSGQTLCLSNSQSIAMIQDKSTSKYSYSINYILPKLQSSFRVGSSLQCFDFVLAIYFLQANPNKAMLYHCSFCIQK